MSEATDTQNQPDSSEFIPDPFTDEASGLVGGRGCGVCGSTFLRSACWQDSHVAINW